MARDHTLKSVRVRLRHELARRDIANALEEIENAELLGHPLRMAMRAVREDEPPSRQFSISALSNGAASSTERSMSCT